MMESQFIINDVDIYTTYRVFLAEVGSEHTNMDSLFAMPEVKSYVTVDYGDEDGEEIAEDVTLNVKALDRTMQFAIIADSDEERRRLYTTFCSFLLISGLLRCKIAAAGEYNLVYKKVGSVSWYTSDTSKYAVMFSVTFRDHKPRIRVV